MYAIDDACAVRSGPGDAVVWSPRRRQAAHDCKKRRQTPHFIEETRMQPLARANARCGLRRVAAQNTRVLAYSPSSPASSPKKEQCHCGALFWHRKYTGVNSKCTPAIPETELLSSELAAETQTQGVLFCGTRRASGSARERKRNNNINGGTQQASQQSWAGN